MSNNYFQTNTDAWGYSYFNGIGQNSNSYQAQIDKYFNKPTKGKYGYIQTLKPGYTQQQINTTGLGEVATYTNVSSDHDDFETEVQKFGIFGAPVFAPAPAPAPKPAPKPVVPYKPTSLATPNAPKQVQFNTSAYDKQIADLSKNLTTIQETLKTNQSAYAKTIADQKSSFEQTTLANQSSFDKLFQNQQAGFDSQLAKQSDAFNAEMAAQTTKYDNNMSALKNSLAATLSSKDAPTLGVKSAALSPKNLAMQRQGIRGTFGRSGLRIKGIKDKSLNI